MSPLLPERQRQLQALRDWARTQGKTPKMVPKPESELLAERAERQKAHKVLTELAHPVSIANAESDPQQ